MMMMELTYRLSYLLALIDILPTTLALQGWPNQGTIVDGNATQFNKETWETSLASPNATGNFSISGFDISKQWPSEQVDGWELSVNVTSSISDSQTLNPSNSNNESFTGTSIYLKAPDSILNSIESNDNATDETTWKICVSVMTNGPDEATSTADNGTCNFLSAQCISDFQEAYADKFAENQNCYASPPSTPESCGDTLKNASFSTQRKADGANFYDAVLTPTQSIP
ncbi:hypothetical protein BJ170DRAFT_637943 [Xylariales sp. AK1849]|nr:hypothetical protein BJ170DRAFT_637943 [Xylariales sp. AK1849]